MSLDPHAPLAAIVGPTASGKTEVALALAEGSGELLVCDSVQVYRGFDVGCAKPTPEERERVPHHLIDLVAWWEGYDAARYVEHARAALAEVRGRGRVPLLCGGTGLYQRALRFGLVDLPPPDPAIRAELEAEEARAPGSLWARLLRTDPEGARRIEPHNLVQIVRALEISAQTGEPASVVRARHGFRREKVPMRVVVVAWPRDALRRRIEERVHQMLAAGWIAEVEGLLSQGVAPDSRPMRSVGYRQVCAVVRGEAPRAGLEDRIAVATWRYAKRQVTWYRKERDAIWLEVGSVQEAIDRARATLAQEA